MLELLLTAVLLLTFTRSVLFRVCPIILKLMLLPNGSKMFSQPVKCKSKTNRHFVYQLPDIT